MNPLKLSRSISIASLLLAATLAVPSARGQAQVGNNGHANDANNQLGSNGLNTPNPNVGRTPNSQLAPGTTPGLGGFHGVSPSQDPNGLRINVQDRAFQNFSIDSAPVDLSARSTGTPNYTPYYDPLTSIGQRTNAGAASNATAGSSLDRADTRLPALDASALGRQPSAAAASQGDPTYTDAQPTMAASSMFGVRPTAATPAFRPTAIDRPSTDSNPVNPESTATLPATCTQVTELERRATAGSDKPFVITSLATGIQSPELAKLLRDAEGQMRSGQFGRSVNAFNAAGQLAPKCVFVPLGRGFAELGAGYYGRAEADLTQAILAEPALLVAQFDLRGFLGADRLKIVRADLADIAATEQTARPDLLLAYVDHNIGADDTNVTAKELDLAAERGANPQLIALMRDAWRLTPPAGK